MAKRDVKKKQAARLRKALTRTPLPAYIDLIKWLKTHGHAQTTTEARKLILAERVKSNANAIGILRNVPVRQTDGSIQKQDVVDPAVPVAMAENITVAAA
jgi:hypothetical protein